MSQLGYYKKKILTLLFLFGAGFTALHGQQEVAIIKDFEPEKFSADLQEFNASNYEQLIRVDECVALNIAAVVQIKSEFARLAEVLDDADTIFNKDNFTAQFQNNVYLKVSVSKNQNGCINVRYADKKYFAGCENAAEFSQIIIAEYPKLQRAIDAKEICLSMVKVNAFAMQVEELPTEDYSLQTAVNLLNLIERTLRTYPEKLNYSIEQYKSLEAEKAPAHTNGLIDFRLKFLNFCKSKINKS